MQCCSGTPTCTGIPAKLLTHAQSFRELIALTVEPSQQQHVKTSSDATTSRLALDKWHDDGRRRCLLHTQGDRFLNPAQVEHIVRWYNFTLVLLLCGTIQAVYAYVQALYSATRRPWVKLQRLLSFLLSNVHSSAGARRLPGSISTGFLTLLTTPDQDRTASKVKKKL